jgi:hypothetical protein
MMTYTVLFSDGFSNGATLPDAPSADNQTNSIAGARDMFRNWLTDSRNDYQRADGYGAPCAYVYLTADYDGIAYGDYPTAAFEYGPRGGIVSVSL